jgi:hypothetical protein
VPFHAPFGGHVKSGTLAQWPDGCKEARKTAGRWGAGADRRQQAVTVAGPLSARKTLG